MYCDKIHVITNNIVYQFTKRRGPRTDPWSTHLVKKGDCVNEKTNSFYFHQFKQERPVTAMPIAEVYYFSVSNFMVKGSNGED